MHRTRALAWTCAYTTCTRWLRLGRCACQAASSESSAVKLSAMVMATRHSFDPRESRIQRRDVPKSRHRLTNRVVFILGLHMLHRAKTLRFEPPERRPPGTFSSSRRNPRPTLLPVGLPTVGPHVSDQAASTQPGQSASQAHPLAFAEMIKALEAVEAKLSSMILEPQGVLWTNTSDIVVVSVPHTPLASGLLAVIAAR